MDDFIITVGDKMGCLEIIDDGSEYPLWVDSIIENIEEEKKEFIDAIQGNKLKHGVIFSNMDGKNSPSYIYEPRSFQIPAYRDNNVRTDDFEEAIDAWKAKRDIKHYKCKCRKCGKTWYYSAETLQDKPPYCSRPMYLSTKFSNSNRAQNGKFNKLERYGSNESVHFVDDQSKEIPSDEYCEKWNAEKKKKLSELAKKDAEIIAKLPRKLAKNYEEDYVGLVYESLEVLECTTDSLESTPHFRYSQRHNKIYDPITVYKEYRCRCYFCGEEQVITCDKFGIYPPTPYGYRAMGGYWSAAYCKNMCHPISSFQWIVTKLLIENQIQYRVEYSFPDLLGCYGKNQLRFDFAIFNKDGTLKCLIECQGEQHYQPVDEFGGKTKHDIQVENDELKRQYVESHKIPLIEISYKDKKIGAIRSALIQNGVLVN